MLSPTAIALLAVFLFGVLLVAFAIFALGLIWDWWGRGEDEPAVNDQFAAYEQFDTALPGKSQLAMGGSWSDEGAVTDLMVAFHGDATKPSGQVITHSMKAEPEGWLLVAAEHRAVEDEREDEHRALVAAESGCTRPYNAIRRLH